MLVKLISALHDFRCRQKKTERADLHLIYFRVGAFIVIELEAGGGGPYELSGVTWGEATAID